MSRRIIPVLCALAVAVVPATALAQPAQDPSPVVTRGGVVYGDTKYDLQNQRLGVGLELIEPPVRLVKLIGDAAMFVGPEPGPVVEAGLQLVEKAADEGDDFPLLRAGLARGEALPRGGDWYGRPVNLASRITAIARPDSVLTDAAVHDALEDSYDWSFAGPRRLRASTGRSSSVDAVAATEPELPPAVSLPKGLWS